MGVPENLALANSIRETIEVNGDNEASAAKRLDIKPGTLRGYFSKSNTYTHCPFTRPFLERFIKEYDVRGDDGELVTVKALARKFKITTFATPRIRTGASANPLTLEAAFKKLDATLRKQYESLFLKLDNHTWHLFTLLNERSLYAYCSSTFVPLTFEEKIYASSVPAFGQALGNGGRLLYFVHDENVVEEYTRMQISVSDIIDPKEIEEKHKVISRKVADYLHKHLHFSESEASERVESHFLLLFDSHSPFFSPGIAHGMFYTKQHLKDFETRMITRMVGIAEMPFYVPKQGTYQTNFRSYVISSLRNQENKLKNQPELAPRRKAIRAALAVLTE